MKNFTRTQELAAKPGRLMSLFRILPDLMGYVTSTLIPKCIPFFRASLEQSGPSDALSSPLCLDIREKRHEVEQSHEGEFIRRLLCN